MISRDPARPFRILRREDFSVFSPASNTALISRPFFRRLFAEGCIMEWDDGDEDWEEEGEDDEED